MTASSVTFGADGFDDKDIGVSWVVTDFYGMLLEASREAAAMLNLSVAGLRRRQLLMFFDGERDHWKQALHAAAAGLMVDREGSVRPRERRPLHIRAEITKALDWNDGQALLWTFSEPESRQPRGVTSRRVLGSADPVIPVRNSAL